MITPLFSLSILKGNAK